MVKTVKIPAKYRGAIAGIGGSLLLISLLGASPLKGAPASKDTRSEPSQVSTEQVSPQPETVPALLSGARVSGDAFEYLTVTEPARSQRSRNEDRLEIVMHAIEDGETTWIIAQRYQTDLGTMQALNPGTNLENIVPGDAIRVVPRFSGLVHNVQPGDTIESIAAAYGASLDEVLKATGVGPDDSLTVGSQVFVPGARLRAQVASRSESQRRSSAAPVAAVAPLKPATPAPVPAPAPAKRPAWVWPLTGDILFSEYGYREGGFHRGLDMAVPYGTPVVAARGGTVIASSWDGGYGYCVTIDHGDGVVTKYAHASELLVEAGEVVAQGQQILLVGSTGNSTGPHLHFEVLINGETVNPRQYLP